MELRSGQNSPVGNGALRLHLRWSPAGAPVVLDASAFLLTASGQVPGDAGFIFYGQTAHPSGAVRLEPGAPERAAFAIDPARLPADIERVVIALSIDRERSRATSFGALAQVTLELTGPGTDLSFPLATAGMEEAALIMGEVYRRGGAWKFRALGQGFRGGLAPLARHYGVEISDAPAPQPAPPPPAPRSTAPISLVKRQPLSLDKPAAGFGKITINLNWSRSSGKRGLFGFGGNAVDLDLGCMLEWYDGYKTVVQALGNSFGAFEQPPYAQLLSDDRTGDAETGEFLLINGAHWAQFKRILVFAFIYEGVPNWAAADGVVTIEAPGIPQLIARLDEPGGDKRMCAVALLQNQAGQLQVTKLIEYFRDHRHLDQAFGFGFRWQAGSK